jgi:hypothetical protein
VSSSSPACGASLLEGVLRCRTCGADARQAERENGAGITIPARGLAPDAFQAAELMDELQTLAPEVLTWWRGADRPGKEHLLRILTDLHAFLRRTPRP